MRVSAEGDSLSATGGVYDAEQSFTSMRRTFMSWVSCLLEASFSDLSARWLVSCCIRSCCTLRSFARSAARTVLRASDTSAPSARPPPPPGAPARVSGGDAGGRTDGLDPAACAPDRPGPLPADAAPRAVAELRGDGAVVTGGHLGRSSSLPELGPSTASGLPAGEVDPCERVRIPRALQSWSSTSTPTNESGESAAAAPLAKCRTAPKTAEAVRWVRPDKAACGPTRPVATGVRIEPPSVSSSFVVRCASLRRDFSISTS